MSINRFEVLEKQARTLQELAATFPQESPQHVAIQNAAFALIFAMSEQYDSFVNFVNASREELSDEQRENLRKLGISA